jgi:hypothetical protein
MIEHGRSRKLLTSSRAVGLLATCVLSAGLASVTLPGATQAAVAAAPSPLQGPNWAKAWYSPNKYRACAAGKTVRIYVFANHRGYKKFYWRGAGETHWGSSSVSGWFGYAREVNTKHRRVTWHIANVPDKRKRAPGGHAIPSSDYGTSCKG